VSQAIPNELRPEFESGDPGRWLTNPVGLRRIYDEGVAALNALPADTPSLRLLADQTADVLAGVSCALNGLALLVGILFVRLRAAVVFGCMCRTGSPR
jgi:hypothetical protein